MDTNLVIKQLFDTYLEPFGHCTVSVNGRFLDQDGNIIHVDSNYELVIIEFMESFKNKYKPTIKLSNDNRVTVNINVVNYGNFCFPITGYDEHHRESLILCPWCSKFVKDGNNVEDVLKICYWIERACLTKNNVV